MNEFWSADVYLLDTRTGERAVYRSDYEGDDPDNPGEYSDFVWAEGNFSCDCNRALFFARALGRDDPNITPCDDGIDRRYMVEKIVRLRDGVTVYQETVSSEGRIKGA